MEALQSDAVQSCCVPACPLACLKRGACMQLAAQGGCNCSLSAPALHVRRTPIHRKPLPRMHAHFASRARFADARIAALFPNSAALCYSKPALKPRPQTRPQVRLEGNQEVLLSDTVGFIQKLPTQLVAAFRATLEEIAAASVVLHVLDVSAPNAAAQCASVLQVRCCRRRRRSGAALVGVAACARCRVHACVCWGHACCRVLCVCSSDRRT